MEIVVCIKQTPVATADKQLDAALLLVRDGIDTTLNAYDEVAVEEALRLKEAHGGSVTVLAMGPEDADDALRKALAMGADRAVLVSDVALRGSDVWVTGLVLAAAISRLSVDLILLGLRTDDAGTGVVAGALAERLGWPLLSNAGKVLIENGRAQIHRRRPDGFAIMDAALPVVVGVTDAINVARYPSLKGIMAAKKKPFERMDLALLQLEPDLVGVQGSLTRSISAIAAPSRSRGAVIEDHGDAAERIVEFLKARKVI